jgi:acyl-CoA synthetase (AMP-forming)/AMP-acid ligase II
LANALSSGGIGRGDRVASLVNNCSQFIEIFFATAKIGAVFVPINFRLAVREVSQLLADCQPKLLFIGESLDSLASELQAGGMPAPQSIVVRDRLADRPAAGPEPYREFVRAHPAREPDVAVGSEEPQLLVYSSGTTGRPKGIVWTHATTLFSSLAKIIDFAIGADDTTVVFGPLFHIGPLMDLAIPLLLRGGRLVVGATTGFDPAVLMRTIAAERASIVTIYPTMWRRVLSLPNLSSYDTSSLRLLLTGGEPIPIPLLRDIYARFPTAGFINTYGSTESGPITTFLATEDRERKIGSVGKPAFSVEVRVADETGAPVAKGTTGELLVRSPFVCNGYANSHPGSVYRAGDWWHTGDLVYCDDEGFIWIGGRKKDMIISGAENIYPAEVERVIAELDGVIEVAVVGVPDEEWGEAVAAYVVLAAGAALDQAAIVDHCRRSLAGYKKPRHVFFVDSLPRTTVNKVSKDTLRAWFSR